MTPSFGTSGLAVTFRLAPPSSHDGSLIDASGESYQALGWAFIAIDDDGEILAAAFGVPPKWVDSIQGAELWAVRMALQSVLLPNKLYTDC
jgi:hypothetical protein